MKIVNFETIDSTNKFVKENHENLDNLTFVCAKEQTSGKGRENRVWYSSPGENLLFSFLIKDSKLVEKYKSLSVGTATLIARFLQLKGLKNVKVKWPNDVYVNDRKICGILLEGNLPNYLVAGVGINVNQTKFDGEYRKEPTSIAIELKKQINIDELKSEFFEFLERHILKKNFESNTLIFFRQNDYLFGKEVSYNNVTGIANGINDDFSLIIGDKVVFFGEVDYNQTKSNKNND